MKSLPYKFLAASLVLLLIFPSTLSAMAGNNVRIDRFKWQRVQTDHFNIYYDKKSEKLAPRMAHYLEQAWQEVGDKLSYKVPGRSDFFFYSNHNQFEQTNVVSIGEGTGGVTEAFKNRFLIFNDGSETWMKHVIFHEFGHIVQFHILFGGFWRSIRLLKSPFYALWLMEGMAEYGSGDIDAATGDMVVRDAVYHNYLVDLAELQGFNHLKPNQVTMAYKTGEAAMQFIASEYGPEKIGALLVTMKDYFDVSSVLKKLLGADIYHIDFRFKEWLNDKYRQLFLKADIPADYGRQWTFTDGLPRSNQGLVVSRDGHKLYFFSDQTGENKIYELDKATGVSKALFGFKWTQFENLHVKGRSLSLSPDGQTLVFAGEKKQRDYIYFFDLKKNKLIKVKPPFKQVRSLEYSADGKTLVCVGMVDGFNDLYLLSRKGKLIEQLTDNPQDEKDPVFSVDGKKVIYSGEVLSDDGRTPIGRDLYSVDIESKNIERIIELRGDSLEPEPLPDGSVIFVRNMNDQGALGYNLYWFKPASGKVVQLTEMIGGAFNPRYNQSNDQLTYVGFNAGEKLIYELDHDAKTKEKIKFSKDQNNTAVEFNSNFNNNNNNNNNNGPRLDKSAMANPLLYWPSEAGSPLFTTAGKKFHNRLSTDLFLPFVFYSTEDGFVGANIWQFSDYLGNHVVQQQAQFSSGNDFIDFGLSYTYARFRPDIIFSFRNEQYYTDLEKTEQRREVQGITMVNYPLDRVHSIAAGLGAQNREDRFIFDSSINTTLKDRFLLAGYYYDTVSGRYLVPTYGRRFGLIYEQSNKSLGGNQNFKTGQTELTQYIRLPRESTFAFRGFYGRSTGDDPQVFRIGGVDKVRGSSRNSLSNKKTNAAIGSGEMRLRLRYLNARTRYFFPDFFFKASYLILFSDIGYGWDNAEERNNSDSAAYANSIGAGISWPTFILQTFQLQLTVLWAHRTDVSSETWYISLGPTF